MYMVLMGGLFALFAAIYGWHKELWNLLHDANDNSSKGG
jgi:hypothetical protein